MFVIKLKFPITQMGLLKRKMKYISMPVLVQKTVFSSSISPKTPIGLRRPLRKRFFNTYIFSVSRCIDFALGVKPSLFPSFKFDSQICRLKQFKSQLKQGKWEQLQNNQKYVTFHSSISISKMSFFLLAFPFFRLHTSLLLYLTLIWKVCTSVFQYENVQTSENHQSAGNQSYAIRKNWSL